MESTPELSRQEFIDRMTGINRAVTRRTWQYHQAMPFLTIGHRRPGRRRSCHSSVPATDGDVAMASQFF
jgi:hypothetical protein